MQTTTKNRILNDGQPFAATTSAPSANGSAKIVCENRISRRNLVTGPPSPLASPCRSLASTAIEIQASLSSNARNRSLAPDRIGGPCAKSIRSALYPRSFRNERLISFPFEQYFAGRKVNPYGSKLIRASPTISVPPLGV